VRLNRTLALQASVSRRVREPERVKILVNKRSVRFRADFERIAARTFVAKAPDPMDADPADLSWFRLNERMRVRRLGPTLEALRASTALWNTANGWLPEPINFLMRAITDHGIGCPISRRQPVSRIAPAEA
jgi:uncharacterized protein YfaT (DUF1175 family)